MIGDPKFGHNAMRIYSRLMQLSPLVAALHLSFCHSFSTMNFQCYLKNNSIKLFI